MKRAARIFNTAEFLLYVFSAIVLILAAGSIDPFWSRAGCVYAFALLLLNVIRHKEPGQ